MNAIPEDLKDAIMWAQSLTDNRRRLQTELATALRQETAAHQEMQHLAEVHST